MGMMAVLISIITGLVAAEFWDWANQISKWIVKLAAKGLSETSRDRYQEEWLVEVDQIPGRIGRVIWAFGLVIAALRMRKQEIGDLGPDDICSAKLHWMHVVVPLMPLCSLAILFITFMREIDNVLLLKLSFGVVALLEIRRSLRALVSWFTTHIVINHTNLVYEEGFLSRRKTVIRLDRILGHKTGQNTIGGMLGYKSMVIVAAGLGEVKLPKHLANADEIHIALVKTR